MKAKVLLMSALIMPFCFVSCNSDDDEELLNNKEISLYVGESIVLEYTGKSCTWSSDNSLIADVDDGVVGRSCHKFHCIDSRGWNTTT